MGRADHMLLDLLEGAHLDLAHALRRDAVTAAEMLEGRRHFGQATVYEDMTLALGEAIHGRRKLTPALRRLLVLRQARFLVLVRIFDPRLNNVKKYAKLISDKITKHV